MPPPKMKLASGQGVNIQLGQWPGSGQALLCLHGLTANLRCWDLIAQRLQGRHQVWAMDLRGRGLSDKPSTGYSLDHHCKDILAVMASLGLERISLMGHSLGAYISLAFAARFPESVHKLILVDGGAELSAEQWTKVGAGIKPSVDRLGKVLPSVDEYLEMVRRGPVRNPWNQYLEGYYRYDALEVAGGVRSRVSGQAVEEERANLAKVKPSELHGKVACPVLILRATQGMLSTDDLLLPADALQNMVAAMEQYRVVNLPGLNHLSLLFQPDADRDQAILDFLAA